MLKCLPTSWFTYSLCRHTEEYNKGSLILSPPTQDSLSVLTLEAESSSIVTLTVVREGGTFGQVRVSWQVTGDHNDEEIVPSNGEVCYDCDSVKNTNTHAHTHTHTHTH